MDTFIYIAISLALFGLSYILGLKKLINSIVESSRMKTLSKALGYISFFGLFFMLTGIALNILEIKLDINDLIFSIINFIYFSSVIGLFLTGIVFLFYGNRKSVFLYHIIMPLILLSPTIVSLILFIV